MSALIYLDCIPLGWKTLQAEPSEGERARWERDNERLLLLIAGLEPASESATDDSPTPRHLQILDLRLQMLTDLLADLLAQSMPLPPQREVRLTTEQLCWQDPAPPESGTLLMVELYLSESLPRPLRLLAQVRGSQLAGEEVVADLQPPGEAVFAQLEKLIFRQHRRRIARERGRD